CAKRHGRLDEAVVAVNDARKREMGRRIIAACDGTVSGKKIALLGLAFKPNTDDMREAPSLAIVDVLREAGASIWAHDPAAMAQARLLNLDVAYAETPYACVDGADAVVIVTEWDVYRALDLGRMKAVMRSPTVVDLRNIYSPQDMAERGFAYTGIGVGTSD
ncbi:MAG: UDP binding domain-containing protein, partial [Pseudomonadota bacterium]